MFMSNEDRPVYHLELRSLPNQAAPVEMRLRRALKMLLRLHGFRAVEVREVPAKALASGEEPAPPADQGTAAL
jgi:hypothetical protein